MRSWVEYQPDSDFSIYNLPYGIFKLKDGLPSMGIAIGEYIINVRRLCELGYLDELDIPRQAFLQETLNDFIACGKPAWTSFRKLLQSLLSERPPISDLEEFSEQILVLANEVEMLLPVRVGDYTDFYSSEDHARNVGKMFRDPENALLPNWKHIPVGYHGRASSIIVSGQNFHRPKGQTKGPNDDAPKYGPSQRMDFELEMGFITANGPELGDSISTKDAEDYIFGFTIFNDWSARDIQKWEYVPLGPFLGKSFASSMSPWIVPIEALDTFRVDGPVQEPKVLPYLEYEGQKHFDVNLEVTLETEAGSATTLSESNFKYMYWNPIQQLAHHTVNGCNIRAGDLLASGTISGPNKGSFGSMLEIAWAGKEPFQLEDGSERKFLHDGDSVIIKAFAEKNGIRVGFGECRAQILPAKS